MLIPMTEAQILIRNVSASDLDVVTLVEATCFPQAEAAPKAALNERIAEFSESFFVAEHMGEIIGFVNGNVTNERVISDDMFANTALHNPEGLYQAIFGLAVIPSFQKQGIAAKLLHHLIADAKDKGRKGVILTCKEQLLPYYTGFGFNNIGVSQSTHGGSEWYDMILEFPIE